jgi:DNA-binding HxlR family transcriptional regulator
VTLGLIGDEWTLLILRHAATGVRRYNDWLDLLAISHAVLTNRLARLTEAGLLVKVAYQDRPARHEYRMTERGRSIWPILVSIWAWELTWVEGHPEPLPRMRHRRCGREFLPRVHCGVCLQPVAPHEIVGRFGPSGSWERSVPAATTRRRSTGSAGLFPQTVALLGNRWSAALLGAAFLGARRFTEFEQRLGAPPSVVAERLRTFCDLGVLAPDPDRNYRLTAKGRAFFPVVMCAVDWGQRWFAAPEGPALVYHHTGCPDEVASGRNSVRLACDRCGEVLRGADIEVVTVAQGPGVRGS